MGFQNCSDSAVESLGPLSEIDHERHEWQMWNAVKDLQNLPLVPLEFMLDNFIPDLQIDVAATKAILEKVGALSSVSGWSGFAVPDACWPDGKTATDFAHMEDIHNHIITSTVFQDGLRRNPNLKFRTYPTFAPVSPQNARSGPDACGEFVAGHSHHYKGLTDHTYWYNTAYVEEYEPNEADGEFRINAKKMLWSMGRMMNFDHRRRFAFGLSIENHTARIWFCCRQVIFATHSFNFMNEPDILIRLIGSLAYATPLQLGYDPSVVLVNNRGRWRFRITIDGNDTQGTRSTKTYEAIRVIGGHFSKIRGRATRIYEVYDIADKNKTRLVLKDSWVDANQALEGDTLATILEGASEDERDLFLTVLQHGVVKIDGKEDRTQDLILHGYDISLAHHFGPREPVVVYRPRLGRRASDSGSMDPFLEFPEPDKSVYRADILVVNPDYDSEIFPSHACSAKLHYRLVFKEKGVSLHEIARTSQAKLSVIMIAMRDTIQALRVMWKKRYVHRDVSPGNIIIFKGRAKLSDLEFAIPYQTPSPWATERFTSPTIGTYDFMAFELICGTFYATPGRVVKVLHNPLHDIESVWWICVWFLFCHYSPNAELSNPAIQRHMKILLLLRRKLFPPFSDPLRDSKVRRAQTVGKDFQKLPWTEFVEPLRQFHGILERMRYEIRRRLYSAEESMPIDLAHFDNPDFYNTFCSFFEAENLPDEELWSMNDVIERLKALKSDQADVSSSDN